MNISDYGLRALDLKPRAELEVAGEARSIVVFLRIGILLFVSLLANAGCTDGQWPEQEFSKDEWAKAHEFERYVFVRDLIEDKELLGRKIDEVPDLLGPPSASYDQPPMLTYVVKEGSGFDGVVMIDIRADPSTRIISTVVIRSD